MKPPFDLSQQQSLTNVEIIASLNTQIMSPMKFVTYFIRGGFRVGKSQ